MTADLIARLEAAERGSRELDGEIFEAVIGPLFPNGTDHFGNHQYAVLFGFKPYAIWDGAHGPRSIPHFTTSLDAIAALTAEKLPGWFVSSAHMPEAYRARDQPAFEVHLIGNICERQFGFDEPPEMDHDTISGAAQTEPLARCVALLRALERIER